jgi:hypothetical protein
MFSCTVLEDARNKLYNNFGIREEYDPQVRDARGY